VSAQTGSTPQPISVPSLPRFLDALAALLDGVQDRRIHPQDVDSVFGVKCVVKRSSRTRRKQSRCPSVLESVLHDSPSTTGVLHVDFWDPETIGGSFSSHSNLESKHV